MTSLSMQRSLSSPVSVSPTATRPPSRSPTPSPETRPEPSRPRRFRSRSPSKLSSGHRRRESSGSVRKIGGDESSRDAASKQQSSANTSAGASALKKPVIDQAVGPPKPPPSPSPASSPPVPSSPLQPILKDQDDSGPFPRQLLADVSLYTNPHLTVENEGTTLEELAHLVRLSKYQERKCANTRIRLQRSLISTALSARLTRCGETSLRNLADSFRNDDKRAFANLFGAIHDVRNSCDATRRYALLEPEMESLQSSGLASAETLVPPPSTTGSIGPGTSVTPFLNDISASAREAFLSFLTQIRTNPDYLATRLCALNTSELQALTTFHQGLEPIESVLPYHGRAGGRGHSSGPSRQSGQTPNAVERLLSFQRHDPLSALIYTCFANSAGPDSAEDKRRTGIWATAFARLISTKSTSEPVLISILNAWSAMRDWSGRANMEWYLMKILEDGAFLLDRAEDQNGTRFNLSDWTTKDSIAAEEFYERAVNDLFAIIDDEDATGIPEGVIELGNEILRRLEMKDSTRNLVDTTRRWFVYKWLFSSWLLAVVIHPESYGMMAEYHITEYGRQKILKQVATLAQHYVVEMLASGNPQKPVSTPLKIKGHVENIMARFKPSGSQRTGRLLPARSITSLRETVEVHPYLVVSPADIVTLINALYPERRPQSAHSSSIRSGAPSISGFSAISQPISIGTSRSNFETASVLSMSTSSVFSDGTTSGEPLLEDQVAGTPQRRSPPVPDGSRQKHTNNYEEDGYRLRLAMHEMNQILGPEVISGSCHPCAERWAIVFISADGSSLSLQMTYDPDDDAEEENSSTTSDTEDEEPDEKPELDKDYHQLRDSVLKLVEDFEIPQGLEDHGTKTTFSNRASGLKKYRSKNKIITPGTSMGSRNPFRSKYEEEQKSKRNAEETARNSEGKDQASESGSSSVLITMLAAASSQSRIQSDFVSAHLYWKTLQQLNALSSPSLRKNGFATLLNIFSRGPRDSIRRSASAIEEYDAWLVWLKQSQERHEGLIETMMKRLKALRDKMWYVTDVHNSAPYEQTRNICSALKIMGVPRKWGTFQRNRAQLARGPAAAYIYRNESQMLDLLAASEDQGGPNKLSDAQAEITSKWLESLGIQNMCSGEERIHRFCCEVDSCVQKLVGENIVDGPVLWSSELYSRDRKAFEGSRVGRGDRESVWGDDAASVISSEHDRRYASPTRRPPSVARDLRNMSAYNTSQVSIDSHRRYSFSRASTAMSDTFDTHDYFGASSPIHAIDSTSTFWSPFQSTMSTVSSATSRAQSPTTSVTNLSSTTYSHPNHQPLPSHHSASRSGASVSSNETVHLRRLSEGKQRFLADLRQTLTSLLLSELGNLVFASGSETDGWFGNLGQECIERRDTEERKARRPSGRRERTSKSSAKQRVIEKRKSFGNLRQAGENSRADLNTDRPDSASGPSNDSSATSDTVSARGKSSKKKDTPDFPYTKAYQRLLGMFAVHPNPYTKLSALLELERLIAASLSNGGRRSRALRHQSVNIDEDSNTLGKAESNESGTDSLRERRSQPFQSHMLSLQPRPAKSADARSIVSVKEAANTDAIAKILRSLFKDAGIRPKTLFRDLQFINSFVSPATLDTDRNKAFWDVVVVALSLKQDVIMTMVEVADEILNFYTPSRKRSGGSDDSPEMLRQPPIHSLRDAAKMWTIAAKEGNATAQRELGLFNLSNPELVERSTLPLSKPRDVFKQAVMEKFGPRSGSMRPSADRSRSSLSAAGPASSGMQDTDDVRSDPTLMCVAIHWMKEAERGGDELARTFLGQNEMMGL
ncbi:uncharacterized protein F4822DRAFT_193535 [Hypoxylon trugodes]|uniref:uncharacterized protein n=1 Tax=Hypoxylon trugodes TaxID=326681 RepID=UPI00218CF140|nr:uncharacterized protein F4822DRAFT_193535 [Hypoxylon trugodes]KAI1391711.1 hypothetical protein F4822DRAFT_193535 [Hypoxylon trugodes]